MQIETLLAHHKQMQDIVDRVLGMRPEREHAAIAAELGKLGQALLAHVETEDRHLYPALRAVGERPEAPVGLKMHIKNFFDEMETLKPTTVAFLKAWDADAIAGNPKAFERSFGELAELLSQRIAREESRLYPLYTEHVSAGALR